MHDDDTTGRGPEGQSEFLHSHSHGTAASENVPIFATLIASRPGKERRSTAVASAFSIAFHAALVFGLVKVTSAATTEDDEDEVVNVIVPIEESVEPPPPPPPPKVEAPPVRLEEVQGFQTLAAPTVVISEIPPPQVNATINADDFSGIGMEGGRGDGKVVGADQKIEAGDASKAPSFTPFTVAPRLTNQPEVARTLERTYPPLLRDAGIGGSVMMWFYIDETGKVINTQVKESSGYPALDEAATKVAEIMKFSPAQNRAKNVPVWVSIPIRFSTR